ncbi:MAG TPA: thioesterase domain-containing protein, partial [Pyrinomonadaceae bacterium]
VDQQVKIRGYRIEPGEIETALLSHEDITDCVVVAREDQPGDRRLVAYVIPDSNGCESNLTKDTVDGKFSEIAHTLVPALRRLLSGQLPQYMTPSAFVLLDGFPLTANGKLDRRALPAPVLSQTGLGVKYVAPRTPTEALLANIWADVLGLKQIGVDKDFFELGGYSLLAVRLFAEIENKFGIKLPLATLFNSATISQLATIIQRGVQPSWSSLIPIQSQGTKPPLFCIHACGAHVFIYRPLVAHLGDDQPVYGLQAQGLDGVREPCVYIEEMAAHYIKEIRALEPQGPYYLAGDTLGGLIAFEIAQQLTEQHEKVAFLAMFDTQCPLPLSLGPRILSHLRHMKQLGPKAYFLSAGGSMARRLGLRFLDHSANVHLTPEEQGFAYTVSASEDPVQRTEWSIYLATQVNYQPPQKQLPGRITYFLARDNQYKSGEHDSRRNWKRGAAEFEALVIPGRHNTIREEPFVATLAEKFISCLRKAQEKDPRYQTD